MIKSTTNNLKGNKKRYLGSIFRPVGTHLGQVKTKVKVEILILKLSMFTLTMMRLLERMFFISSKNIMAFGSCC